MPYYNNSGATYDSGLRYAGAAAQPKKNMNAKINLDLKSKNDEEIRTLATDHKNSMAGNVNYPTPVPSALVFDQDLQNYSDELDGIAVDEAALAARRTHKDQLLDIVKSNLTARGAHVQSGGDPAKIQTSGLDLQAAATPTTSMPQPQKAVATTGDMSGEVDLACDAVPRTKTYLWECRTHEDGQPAGAWVSLKPAGRSSTTATGLIPGKEYAFRVQVLGPNETTSPWSDECIARAA